LNAHLNSGASKIAEKVSGWAGFFDIRFYHSILNRRSAQAFNAYTHNDGYSVVMA
jgi:hypothetical protein